MDNFSTFKIHKNCKSTRARKSTLSLTVPVNLPTFMPVATYASMRAVPFSQLKNEIILMNAYHCRHLSDLKRFTKWKNALLTDSGGFQIGSLAGATVVEEGVIFPDYFSNDRENFRDRVGDRVNLEDDSESKNDSEGKNGLGCKNDSESKNIKEVKNLQEDKNIQEDRNIQEVKNIQENKVFNQKNVFNQKTINNPKSAFDTQESAFNYQERTFNSQKDKSQIKKVFSPEDSILVQISLGADIIMQLDDVVPPTSPRVEEAMERSTRWLSRCYAIFNKINPPNQILFPIIQGGLNLKLRKKSIDEILKFEPRGVAIGGLCGGEKKIDFCRVVNFCVKNIKKDIPVYVMGVGYPEDVVVCVALGVDMMDCVYPTRTARFGRLFFDSGDVCVGKKRSKSFVGSECSAKNECFIESEDNIDGLEDKKECFVKNNCFKGNIDGYKENNCSIENIDGYKENNCSIENIDDFKENNCSIENIDCFKGNNCSIENIDRVEIGKNVDFMDDKCDCFTCKNYSLEYLDLIRNTTNFCTLTSLHNLHYMHNLGVRMRNAIENGNFDVFVKKYLKMRFGVVPEWVKEAMGWVNIYFD